MTHFNSQLRIVMSKNKQIEDCEPTLPKGFVHESDSEDTSGPEYTSEDEADECGVGGDCEPDSLYYVQCQGTSKSFQVFMIR